MNFDALIVGGSAAGLSTALILGSAVHKPFVKNKKIGLVAHQKSAHLKSALLNNALGIPQGTKGQEVLDQGILQLENSYPSIELLKKEKVVSVHKLGDCFKVQTNRGEYQSKIVVIAIGYTADFSIKGLETYIDKHPKAKIAKKRIWLKNDAYLVDKNLYVAGTLAGGRSQFAIACGSGAQVATDILTLWNNGIHTKHHDKIKR